MSIPSQQYMKVDKRIVGGLIEIVSLSQQLRFPSELIDADEVEMVIDALRVIRPETRELDALESMLWMSRGRWDESIQTLQGLLQEKPDFSYAKGLLALALFSRGDPTWQQVAAELEESEVGEDTRQLVRSLRARADLRVAMETYHKTGNFTLPESCAEQLREFEQQKAAADNGPVNAVYEGIPPSNFLRL